MKNKNLLIAIVLWVSLWIFPWAVWLSFVPWVKLAIAMIIFVVPGIMLSFLLAEREFTFLTHISTGLALSVFIVGSLGLIGRIFHFPFAYIKPLFALIGLVILLIFLKQGYSRDKLYTAKNYSVITLISLLVILVLSIVNSLGSHFGGDDLSYLGYLTSWQHAQHLDFKDVFFGLENIGQIRFWFAMFPMDLAVLAEISHLHGLLLLGYYIEPFLIVIAVITAYNLYENLLQSENQAIIALLLQFIFLLLLQDNYQFGRTFFNRMSEDKVFSAFILAPVFFIAVKYFLNLTDIRSACLVLLTGLSLALTHPIILAYSIFITTVYVGIVTITQKSYKKFGTTVILFVIILLPPSSLRVVSMPWVSRHIFGLSAPLAQPGVFDAESAMAGNPDIVKTRITNIPETPFYGFNLNIIKIQIGNGNQKTLLKTVFSELYLYILLLGILWSLFHLKKKRIAPFVTAASLLILICGIPYTGWLMGYLVTARMLWRAPWLMPIGLVSCVLLHESYILLRVGILKPLFRGVNHPIHAGVINLLCLILILFLAVSGQKVKWDSLSAIPSYRNGLEHLVKLGNYLEVNLDHSSRFVSLNQNLMNYLPGLSSKSKVIAFRGNGFNPSAIDVNKIKPIFSRDPSISIYKRISVLKKYKIEYVLVEDSVLRDYYLSYSPLFQVWEVNGFWIVEYH